MTGSNGNFSFGSGQDNPDGLHLKLMFDEDTKTAYGEFRCPDKFQGAEKKFVHPGVLSVILDEIMARINEAMNFDTVTGELTIRYLQPAETNENLHLRGWFVKKNRRIVENRAEIENEIGKIVARGKGKYIEKEES
jgi:acyl-coenzyme A thioesterase PaaI-like protein